MLQYMLQQDQIVVGIGNVLQVVELNLLLRGEADDLVKVTGRVSLYDDAAKREELVEVEGIPGVVAIADDQVSHRSFGDPTGELSMKAPMSVSKPTHLGRGSQAVDLRSMVTCTGETMFTQVRTLLMEVKPYVLLLFIFMMEYRVQS